MPLHININTIYLGLLEGPPTIVIWPCLAWPWHSPFPRLSVPLVKGGRAGVCLAVRQGEALTMQTQNTPVGPSGVNFIVIIGYAEYLLRILINSFYYLVKT